MSISDIAEFSSLTDRCFISTPFSTLAKEYLPYFLKNRLNPEISLETDLLWTAPRSTFAAVAKALKEEGLACTLHAPFLDLTPGGFEPKIIEVTREKLRRAFDLLDLFEPRSIVCHLAYEHEKHYHNVARWFEASLTTWEALLPVAQSAKVPVMFENTFEKDPGIHLQLFHQLKTYSPGFCLDTGHVLCFSSTPWQEWIKQLGPWLGQLHVHDNDGSGDSHDVVGKGKFEFSLLFDALAKENKKVLCTLEQHSQEKIKASLEALSHMNCSAFNIP